MGYMAHHTVLVHDWQARNGNPERVEEFRAGLEPDWAALVVGPIETVINAAKVYAFLPDGSKEGWPDSDEGNRLRDEFVTLFAGTYAEVAVVRFGGDDPEHAYVEDRSPWVEAARMTARTISADDLETLARAAHADIELPGPEGGWAVAVINGREYRASVPPVPVEPVEES